MPEWDYLTVLGEVNQSKCSKEDNIQSLAFNVDGSMFASGDGSGRVVIFRTCFIKAYKNYQLLR